jgi:hypothetical protein
MIVSNDGGFAGAAWEPFRSSRSWTITSYGQTPLPRTVYVKFLSGGSISGLYQDDIIFDPNPPTGSLSITGTLITRSGILTEKSFASNRLAASTIYLPILSNNNFPGYTQVSLHLSAQDDLSGVAEMIVGLDPDFTAASWEPYVEWKDDWLPEKGGTTLYACFRDRAGNLSTVVSDTYTP